MSIAANGNESSSFAHSFTPVQRRHPTQNNLHLHADAEKEWSAIRCHRLLRPITSRLAILEKEVSVFPRSNPEPSTRPKRYCSRSQNPNRRRSEDGQGSDAEWTQQPAKKRVKRTYSSRRVERGSQGSGDREGYRASSCPVQNNTSIPGAIAVPTPMLKRTFEDVEGHDNAPIAPRLNKYTKTGRLGFSRKEDDAYSHLLALRGEIPAHRYSTYDGIFHGFETLLRSTSQPITQKVSWGNKSLLDTCLRKIPDYIASEERIHAKEDNDHGGKSTFKSQDISGEIYDDLESLGSSGLGWKHLRTVVRAHGVYLVANAARNGVLDWSFCSVLICLCIEHGDSSAAETILSSLQMMKHAPRPKTIHSHPGDSKFTGRFSLLWNYPKFAKRRRFQFRQLSILLRADLIPLEWLATKDFGQVWTAAIQGLNRQDTDAVEFLQTSMALLSRCDMLYAAESRHAVIKDTELIFALKQTYLSLLTTLSSIAILRGNQITEEQFDKADFPPSESSIIVDIFRSCLTEPLLPEFPTSYALLAISLLAINSSQSGNSEISSFIDVQVLLGLFRKRKYRAGALGRHSIVAEHICSIARCCGRGASESGLRTLKDVHGAFEKLLVDATPEDHSTLSQILIDSAFAFQRHVPNRDHLEYAAQSHTKYDNSNNLPLAISSPSGTQSNGGGFRWEEGIGEWVTATPAAGFKKTKLTPVYDSDDDLLDSTPFRISKTQLRTCYNTNDSITHSSRREDAFEEIPSSPASIIEAVFDVSIQSAHTSISSSEGDESEEDDIVVKQKPGPINKTASRVVICAKESDASDDELSFCEPEGSKISILELKSSISQSRFRTRRFKGHNRRKAYESLEHSEDELCL